MFYVYDLLEELPIAPLGAALSPGLYPTRGKIGKGPFAVMPKPLNAALPVAPVVTVTGAGTLPFMGVG